MELIMEIIADIFFEGSVEIAKSSKFAKAFRNIALVPMISIAIFSFYQAYKTRTDQELSVFFIFLGIIVLALLLDILRTTRTINHEKTLDE